MTVAESFFSSHTTKQYGAQSVAEIASSHSFPRPQAQNASCSQSLVFCDNPLTKRSTLYICYHTCALWLKQRQRFTTK